MPRSGVDVSILVLAYNHAPYIATCLDSLLAQDFVGRVEILVGEDCSTDATPAILAEYAREHPHIKILTSAANVGMLVNHRRLLAASAGTYVAYCEGDDYWHDPSKLTRQVAFLHDHPQLAGVYTDVDHIVRRGSRWARLPSYWSSLAGSQAPTTTFEDLLVRNTVQTCSVLVRGDLARSFLESTLADGHYAVDDWPMFLHLTRQAPLGRIDESLATYRRVPGSATNSGAANNERRLMDQFRLIDDAARLKPGSGSARAAGLRSTKQALVDNAVVHGDRDLLLRALSAGAHWGVPTTFRHHCLKALFMLPLAPSLMHRYHERRQAGMERAHYR